MKRGMLRAHSAGFTALSRVADVVLVLGSGALAYALRFRRVSDALPLSYAAVIVIAALLAALLFPLLGVYRSWRARGLRAPVGQVLLGWVAVFVLILLMLVLSKFHDAKVRGDDHVTLWGTGTPRREFLHVDDLARACLYVMEHYEGEAFLNAGVGEDVSIRELAELVQEVVGFGGRIDWDASKPDGTPRKLLDVGKLHALGWQASIPLREGVAATYQWYLQHLASARAVA